MTSWLALSGCSKCVYCWRLLVSPCFDDPELEQLGGQIHFRTCESRARRRFALELGQFQSARGNVLGRFNVGPTDSQRAIDFCLGFPHESNLHEPGHLRFNPERLLESVAVLNGPDLESR